MQTNYFKLLNASPPQSTLMPNKYICFKILYNKNRNNVLFTIFYCGIKLDQQLKKESTDLNSANKPTNREKKHIITSFTTFFKDDDDNEKLKFRLGVISTWLKILKDG